MSKTVVQEALNSLIDDLRATHGDNLASVVLYGSAAAGDHVLGEESVEGPFDTSPFDV